MSFNNWNSADDEILIDFVRNHEAIYNLKLKDYRKTQLKQTWWSEVGEILNKTDHDCYKRWVYIRDYYVRRRAKPGTGSSGEAAKKRSDLLSFLDNLPSSQRSTITNVVDENSRESSVKLESTHDNSEGTQTLGENTENTHSIKETQTNTNSVCDNNNKDGKATSDKIRNNNALAQERLNQIKQIANQNSTQNVLDENDLFFGSMVKIVKKLPPYEQVQLRLQIGSLVGYAELRHISNNSPQSIAASPRPSTNNSDYYENLVPSPMSATTTTSTSSAYDPSHCAPSPQHTQLITVDEQPGTRLISVDEQGQVQKTGPAILPKLRRKQKGFRYF